VNELIKEIGEFAPHSEALTVSSLLAVNQGINVINLSKPGFGKTRCSRDLFDMMNVDYEIVSGRVTPKKFFQRLQQVQNGGMMIIDQGHLMFRIDRLDRPQGLAVTQ